MSRISFVWPLALVTCVVLGCSGPVVVKKIATVPPEPRETIRMETVKRPDLDQIELQVRLEGRVLSVLATRTLMCEERTLADTGQGIPKLKSRSIRECGVTQSEVGLSVRIQGSGETRSFRTDGNGVLNLDVFERLKAFPFSIPFVVISCGYCKQPESLTLSDSISGDYVIQRNVLAEMELWMAANMEHPQLASVAAVVDAEKQRLAKEQAAMCKKAYKEALALLNSKASVGLRRYGARGDIEGAEADLSTAKSEECRASISDAKLRKLDKLRKKRRASHDKAEQKLEEAARVVARGFFAQLLTDRLLKQGVSAEVTVGKSGNTRLTIFMPAANDAVAYHIRTSSGILQEAQAAGFKKVVLKACHRLNCRDKYFYWTWEL